MFDRIHQPLPDGLIITENGRSQNDPHETLRNLEERTAALLPLGGIGEGTSGYKGFGYATFVEILSSALQDGIFLKDTAGIIEEGQKRLKVGHFFLAININHFTSLKRFKQTTGTIMRNLRTSKKAPGKSRIYTAGEKEFFSEKDRKTQGIPINKSLQKDIKTMQKELKLFDYTFPF